MFCVGLVKLDVIWTAPSTCNLLSGSVVPMPRLPLDLIRIFSFTAPPLTELLNIIFGVTFDWPEFAVKTKSFPLVSNLDAWAASSVVILPAKVVFPEVSIVITVPVPSESDISKFLLACTLVNTQLPVFAPKVKDELLATPLTSSDWPVVTFPAKVAFPSAWLIVKTSVEVP